MQRVVSGELSAGAGEMRRVACEGLELDGSHGQVWDNTYLDDV